MDAEVTGQVEESVDTINGAASSTSSEQSMSDSSSKSLQKEAGHTGPSNRSGGHRAGFDAFMTGFIFAFYTARYGKIRSLASSVNMDDLGMEEYKNKVYLGGKDIPLPITKSVFAKTSKDHRAKLEKLQRMMSSRT